MEEAKFSEICETPYILWPSYKNSVQVCYHNDFEFTGVCDVLRYY